MCIILDANRFSDALTSPPDPRYEPIIRWILNGDGLLVFGGTRYYKEIDGHAAARKFFADRFRAGQAYFVPHDDVDAEEAVVMRLGECTSDDEHVIALARVAGARTLCTEDVALMADFKNVKLVPKPRGRVYRLAAHARLLQHDAGCRRPPETRNRYPKKKAKKRR